MAFMRTCAFCKGLGEINQPVSRECSVCRGQCNVWVNENFKECDICHGDGADPSVYPALQPCRACKGTGTVPPLQNFRI